MVSNLRIGILGGGFAGLYTLFFLGKFFPQGIDITLFVADWLITLLFKRDTSKLI